VSVKLGRAKFELPSARGTFSNCELNNGGKKFNEKLTNLENGEKWDRDKAKVTIIH